jgi:hypothetical protein
MCGKKTIGIVIYDRYHNDAGGKCLQALHNQQAALTIANEVKRKDYD